MKRSAKLKANITFPRFSVEFTIFQFASYVEKIAVDFEIISLARRTSEMLLSTQQSHCFGKFAIQKSVDHQWKALVTNLSCSS